MSRVLSPLRGGAGAIIHLGPHIAVGLKRPTRTLRRTTFWRVLFGLAPDGVYRAASIAWGTGSLLHYLFTLTLVWAVCFLWHWPAGYPEWMLSTILCCGARTFLETFVRRAIAWVSRVSCSTVLQVGRVVGMKILLPPSEGKCAAVSGACVELGGLSFPFLTEARERVGEVLAEVSAGVDALSLLKVGTSLSVEVERNTRIFEEPAHEAWWVYTGVLFEALNVPGMSVAERELACRHVLVVSALWGVVRLDDVIPAYRLSMGVKLPEVGSLANFWRSELAALNDVFAGELFVDCRSSAYVKAWVTPPAQTVQVRVERLLSDGSRKVVSHMAKHFRGELTRFLVTRDLVGVQDACELARAVGECWQVELVEPTNKKAGVLTLVVPG